MSEVGGVIDVLLGSLQSPLVDYWLSLRKLSAFGFRAATQCCGQSRHLACWGSEQTLSISWPSRDWLIWDSEQPHLVSGRVT